MSTKPERWIASDADCEVWFLMGAADLTELGAVRVFCRMARQEYGTCESVDGEPLAAELRPYRETREGDPYYGDSILTACSPGEEPSEWCWVIEGAEVGSTPRPIGTSARTERP